MSKINVALGGMTFLDNPLAVSQLRRNAQLPLAADLHSGDPFVPSLDDLPSPRVKFVGLVRVDRTVELLAGGQPSGVVHLHVVAPPWLRRRSRL